MLLLLLAIVAVAHGYVLPSARPSSVSAARTLPNIGGNDLRCTAAVDDDDAALELFLSEPHPRVSAEELSVHVEAGERESKTLSSETLTAAQRALETYGVVCLRGVWQADKDLVSDLVAAIDDNYEACVTAVRARADLASSDSFAYRQMVHRSSGRYDMLLDDGVALRPLPPRLKEAVLGGDWRRQLLEHLVGADCTINFTAALYAKDGCASQDPHADGRHPRQAEAEAAAAVEEEENENEEEVAPRPLLPPHAVQLFLPLCEMGRTAGPTEFWPTSHLPANSPFASLLPPLPLEARPGDAILFDFRTIHRGTANTSGRWRPILYQTCTAGWFVDDFNFPEVSLLSGEEEGETQTDEAAWEQERGAAARAKRSGFVPRS